MEIRPWSRGVVFFPTPPTAKGKDRLERFWAEQTPNRCLVSLSPILATEHYQTGAYSQSLHHPLSMCCCCYRFAFSRSLCGFIIRSMVTVPQ